MLTVSTTLRSSAACSAESVAHRLIESNVQAQLLSQVNPALSVLADSSGACRGFSSANARGFLDPFAMIFPMGTLEDTKEKGWTWILGAPLSAVTEAGVEFDPNSRSTAAAQGDTASASALEVSNLLVDANLGKCAWFVPADGFCKKVVFPNREPRGSQGRAKAWLCCLRCDYHVIEV